MPLKGIPFIISPELLATLCRAGHGDEIVLADAHFPTSSVCMNGPQEIRADGHKIPELLEAILTLFPLDTYVESPCVVMDLVPEDQHQLKHVPVWSTYQEIASKAEKKQIILEKMERFAFYERAKKAFAVVHTGETAQYGNLIIKKGVVIPQK